MAEQYIQENIFIYYVYGLMLKHVAITRNTEY